MTDQKPCLPGCGSFRELSGLDRHAPGCPNAFAKGHWNISDLTPAGCPQCDYDGNEALDCPKCEAAPSSPAERKSHDRP